MVAEQAQGPDYPAVRRPLHWREKLVRSSYLLPTGPRFKVSTGTGANTQKGCREEQLEIPGYGVLLADGDRKGMVF